MAASWIISNILQENFGENDETQQKLQTIAANYIEREKRELHAQIARVETIRLQLEIGNLISILSSLIEITDAQDESDGLLEEYQKLHLRVFFDMECEMEKINTYDEIKLELESRDSMHFHHQLYMRKLKVATNMEARNIVKGYRKVEEELLKSQDDLIALQKSMVKSKENKTDLCGLIYCLVRGSKDLEYAHSCKSRDKKSAIQQHPPETVDVIKTTQPSHKRGLSARLSLGLTNFKMPFVPCLPKIPTIDSSRFRVRLLQQAEDIRRAMQKATEEPSIPKFSGILKNPMELPTSEDSIRKTVSFQSDPHEEIHPSQDSLSSVSQIIEDATTFEPTYNTELKENFTDVIIESPKRKRVEILENIIIKPARVECSIQTAEPSSVPKTHVKRKIMEAKQNVGHSPPKIKRTDDQNQSMAGRSFLDMFLDISKENLTVSSTLDESEKDEKNVAKGSMDNRKESTKGNIRKLGKKSKDSFDDFEDFFSGFAGNDKDISDEGETLDFFANVDNNDGTGGSDNSFDF